ncbi:MAG: sigma 54-interacting transcriptional regulator [Polyangiaceae bacterium]
MDRTESDLEQTARRAAVDEQPALLVAYHPQREFIGNFLHLQGPREQVLGRGYDGFGEGGLDDSLISRQHVAIRRRGQAAEVQDLDSQNGTLLNGAPLTDRVMLAPGDVLALGRVALVFQLIPAYHRAPTHRHIVGTGPATARLLEQIDRAAPLDAAVLLQGEAGVGKELVARALHDHSERNGRFVALNCGAVADGVMHSELFGHLRGAFSGAAESRAGLVKDAEDGTLLLDEIGDASPAFQVALLRLLEQKEYRAVGSDETRQAKARVVAATHVPLLSAVEAGHFRHDLYTRLTERVIEVSPLRSRREDIVAIAHHLLDLEGRSDATLSRTMAQELLVHDWPGNVRELRSVVRQALSDSDGDSLVTGQALRPSVSPPLDPNAQTQSVQVGPRSRPTPEELADGFRRQGGNMQALAGELGVGRNTLYRWFRDASLDPGKLRDS